MRVFSFSFELNNPFPEQLALEKTSNQTGRIILISFSFFYREGLFFFFFPFFNTCSINRWSFYVELGYESESSLLK